MEVVQNSQVEFVKNEDLTRCFQDLVFIRLYLCPVCKAIKRGGLNDGNCESDYKGA